MGQFPTVTEGGDSQNGICPQVLLVFGPGEWPSGGAGAGPREQRAGMGRCSPVSSGPGGTASRETLGQSPPGEGQRSLS